MEWTEVSQRSKDNMFYTLCSQRNPCSALSYRSKYMVLNRAADLRDNVYLEHLGSWVQKFGALSPSIFQVSLDTLIEWLEPGALALVLSYSMHLGFRSLKSEMIIFEPLNLKEAQILLTIRYHSYSLTAFFLSKYPKL